MPKHQISRRFEWDSGHRLLNHSGQCKYLHGHRYAAEVYVSSYTLDDVGMSIDFKDLEDIVGKWIKENWDHNMILNSNDPIFVAAQHFLDHTEYSFSDLWGGSKEPYELNNKNPTVENLVVELAEKIGPLIAKASSKLTLEKIRMWETPKSAADWPVA